MKKLAVAPGMLVVAVFIMAVGCIPYMSSARQAQTETAAIGTLRTIHQAEVQYYSTYGRYATLSELGPTPSSTPSPKAAGLLANDIASGTKLGYKFIVNVTPTGYTINANPVNFGDAGRRTFFSDQSMAVHQNFSQDPAGPSSPTLQ